jgi:hypothetical protein
VVGGGVVGAVVVGGGAVVVGLGLLSPPLPESVGLRLAAAASRIVVRSPTSV